MTTFPYVRPPPPTATGGRANEPPPSSLRSARPRWQAGTKARASAEPRQRCLVFCLGGMTYSEMRAIYEVSSSSPKDVYIGMEHFVILLYFLTFKYLGCYCYYYRINGSPNTSDIY